MTVLDSFAVLALLKDEPAASRVELLIRSDAGAALTALGVVEVLDHLIRLVGVDEDDAVLDLAQLGLAEPFIVDSSVATRAGLLRARHYHRRSRAVSLADCVAAETARDRASHLVTSDPHLLETCAIEGIAYIALADTSGTIWVPDDEEGLGR
ncbi:MAG: PIN domain-containing protein [Ilumatobacteraceae bacterium]